MKQIALFLIVFVAWAFVPSSSPIKPDCTCKGIKLWGRVRVVDSFENFRVRVVNDLQDFNVRKVDSQPYWCGEWQFVDSHEDFTIRFVDSHEDFTIKFVDSFPGIH
ncbi:MAG: hypothetical protein ABIK31_06010 [candidate division WOR-3 bacterium]